jgi:hypothetical protein
LLPGREVAALVDLVEVDQVGIGFLGPAARGLVLLAGKDGHGNRDGDALGVEEATTIFPIQARRRNSCVRQPVKRDVVEDLVTRQFARIARGPVQGLGYRRGRLAVGIVVVEKPCGQADGRIRDAVQRLRAPESALYNCKDFTYQEDAQRVYDRDPSDPYHLGEDIEKR